MNPADKHALGAMTDETLIELVRNNDDEAFRELMARYIDQLWKFVRQYAKTAEDSEDIVQDAFFKTWKYIKRFKKGKIFKPWLYTIARNTALDYAKKKRSATFSDLDDDENDIVFAETLIDPEPLAAEVFERKQSVEELDSAMKILHPDHRAVLVMHYEDEMTFEEIASVVGKPMNTIKSWHRRALIKLREELARASRNENI